jgi:hypothetical protein
MSPVIPCLCDSNIHYNESLVFKSGPLSPGKYTVDEVAGNLGSTNFTVTGPANVTNRLPVINTFQKSMSATVYNVRGELISRTTNRYIHGIVIVKTGDAIEKIYR